MGTSLSLGSVDAFHGIPASMLRAAIEAGRQREPHLEPVSAVMLACGVALVLVNQADKGFRLLCDARPSVVIVGEYTDRGIAWIEAITRAVPRRPLVISAAKRGAA